VVMAIPHPAQVVKFTLDAKHIHRSFHWWFFQMADLPTPTTLAVRIDLHVAELRGEAAMSEQQAPVGDDTGSDPRPPRQVEHVLRFPSGAVSPLGQGRQVPVVP